MPRIVPRNEWCDIPRRSTPSRIALPTRSLYIHHGYGGTSTVATARAYARYHIRDRGWADVGYSFIIAAGQVLEGRGAGRQGAHTSGSNTTAHGICVAGDYTSKAPSDRDMQALAWLVAHGRQQGWWGEVTGGHRDAPGASTSCPGTALHRLLPTLGAAAVQGRVSDGDVASWQRDLMRWDPSALPDYGADGDFGAETRAWTIRFMRDTGLISSSADPDAPVVGPKTRDKMAAVLDDRAKPASAPPAPAGPYPDVPADHTFADEIARARELGLMSGKADGTFGLGETVTREQLAAVAVRAVVTTLELLRDANRNA